MRDKDVVCTYLVFDNYIVEKKSQRLIFSKLGKKRRCEYRNLINKKVLIIILIIHCKNGIFLLKI